MRKSGTAKINWHSCSFSALKFELVKNMAHLLFQREFVLNTGSRRIDMVIVKKDPSMILENPIGHIFRKHNLVEYKSPCESLTCSAYYKTISYALSYKTRSFGKEYLDLSDITITLITFHYPRRLLKELRKRGIRITKYRNGIYYIEEHFFQVQLVVTQRLDSKEHIWLKSLTNQMTSQQDADLLTKAYKAHLNEEEYQEYMNTIIRANQYFSKEGGQTMCEALYELFAPELQAKWEGGRRVVNKLNSILFRDNRIDDLRRSTEDLDFQQQLIQEYQLN